MSDLKPPDILEDYPYKRIGEAFYFPSQDIQIYNNGPGITSSKIRRFAESPLHALEQVTYLTSEKIFESAAHTLIVDGEGAFFTDFETITKSIDADSNKNLRDKSLNDKKTVISQNDTDTIYRMKGSIVHEAHDYLFPGQGYPKADEDFPNAFDSPNEVSLYWYDQGLLCKTRPSIVINPIDQPKSKKSLVLINYVIIDNCSVDGFIISAKKNSYYLKAAWNKKGFEKAGFEVDDIIFIAQETVQPYANKVFKMNSDDIETASNLSNVYLTEYNRMLNGKPATAYNSPNIVELDKI